MTSTPTSEGELALFELVSDADAYARLLSLQGAQVTPLTRRSTGSKHCSRTPLEIARHLRIADQSQQVEKRVLCDRAQYHARRHS